MRLPAWRKALLCGPATSDSVDAPRWRLPCGLHTTCTSIPPRRVWCRKSLWHTALGSCTVSSAGGVTAVLCPFRCNVLVQCIENVSWVLFHSLISSNTGATLGVVLGLTTVCRLPAWCGCWGDDQLTPHVSCHLHRHTRTHIQQSYTSSLQAPAKCSGASASAPPLTRQVAVHRSVDRHGSSCHSTPSRSSLFTPPLIFQLHQAPTKLRAGQHQDE